MPHLRLEAEMVASQHTSTASASEASNTTSNTFATTEATKTKFQAVSGSALS